MALKVKKGIFFKNGLHFREANYSIACGGTNGYIPDFRFVYDKETNNWKIIGGNCKTPEWTDKYGVFEEDGIHVHNVSTDANVIVRYADLVIFSETSHIYMMMTKGWQMIPIFKDKLEAGEDVKGFLQDQDTGIKW